MTDGSTARDSQNRLACVTTDSCNRRQQHRGCSAAQTLISKLQGKLLKSAHLWNTPTPQPDANRTKRVNIRPRVSFGKCSRDRKHEHSCKEYEDRRKGMTRRSKCSDLLRLLLVVVTASLAVALDVLPLPVAVAAILLVISFNF